MSEETDQQPLLAAEETGTESQPNGREAKVSAKEGNSKSDKKGSKPEMKRSPNRLMVDEAHGDGDNSCIMLSAAKMEGNI